MAPPVRPSTVASPPASWPSTTRATGSSAPRPKPSASGWATTVTLRTPTSGRPPSTPSPTASPRLGPTATTDERRPWRGPRRALAPAPRPASPGHRRPPLRHGRLRRGGRCWASRSFRGNHALYLRAAATVDEAPQGPRVRPARRRALQGLPQRPTPVALLARAGRHGQRPRRQGPAPVPRRGPLDRPRRRRRPGPSASPTVVSTPDPDGPPTCPTSRNCSRSSPTPPVSSRTTSPG